MTVIATAANPRFNVSRVDIDRDGPTYTIDTLRDLRAEMPDAELYFITGADALADIFTWRDADELFELAHFVGCTRPGYAMDQATLDKIPSDQVTMVEIPALAISSTDCRERKHRGEPVWYLVPDGVVQYIAKHDLYASHSKDPHDRHRPRRSSSSPSPARPPTTSSPRRSWPSTSATQLAITDAFVLATATNEPAVKAIVDEVEEKLREVGRQADPSRGPQGGPLGAPRLRRDRRPRPARGGARRSTPSSGSGATARSSR